MKSIFILGKEIPLWVASIVGGGLLAGLIFLATSNLIKDSEELARLNQLRLFLEDETLLCSNDEYSTQYAGPHLMKIETALTQETIDSKKAMILEQMERAETEYKKYMEIRDPSGVFGDLSGYGLEHFQFIENYNYELKRLDALEPAETDVIEWVYPKPMNKDQEELKRIYEKYFLPYANELNLLNKDGSEFKLPYNRRTFITLSDESYLKLGNKMAEDSNNALKGIKDLKCIEWLYLSSDNSAKEVNISPLKNFKNLKILEAPKTRIKSTGFISNASVLQTMPNLRILDIRGNLDYKCITTASTKYDESKLYLHNNSNLDNWSCPPDKNNPDTYYNKKDTNRWEQDVINYNNCGSDLSAFDGLSYLRMVYLPGAVHNFTTLLEINSIKFISMKSMGVPIDFDIQIKDSKKDDVSKKESGEEKNPSEENLELDKDSDKSDKNNINNDMVVLEFLPELEYLNIGGNILAVPFMHLKKLSELYIDIKSTVYNVDLTSIKTLKQLKKLDITASATENFCKTLDNYLPDTEISCDYKETLAEKIAKDMQKPIHERNFNIASYPYPGVTQEHHEIFRYRPETDADIELRGIDTIYKYASGGSDFTGFGGGASGGSGAGGSWEEDKSVSENSGGGNNNLDNNNDSNNQITFSWVAWGDWSSVTSYYQTLQRYIRNNYNSGLELFRYSVGTTRDGEPIVEYEHMSQRVFEERINALNPQELRGSLNITVCDPNRVDQKMWFIDYSYNNGKLNPEYYHDKLYSINDVFTGEVEDERSWTRTVFRDNTIVKQIGLTEDQYNKRYSLPMDEWQRFDKLAGPGFGGSFRVGAPGFKEGVFAKLQLRGFGLPRPDLSGTGWPEPESESADDDKKSTGKDELEKLPDYIPILTSPADMAEIDSDKEMVFTWKPSPDALHPIKYYWHVTINDEVPLELDAWFGLDVGKATSFTYPSDMLNRPLPLGIWVWRVGAEYAGSGIYWSEDRILVRNWVLP